jgi:hypothetical protein
MTPELGQINRPDADKYSSTRKIFLVPLILYNDDSPDEYKQKCRRFWLDVMEQLAHLEMRLGPVRHVYHESITIGGEQGLALLDKYNSAGAEITKVRRQSGAELEVTEDKDAVEEALDWERCLLIGLMSEKVVTIVSTAYTESLRKRYEFISRKIDETLKENESGLLIISEGHKVQFPKTIEVFVVSPPSLNEIHRYLRDRPSNVEQSMGTDQPADNIPQGK